MLPHEQQYGYRALPLSVMRLFIVLVLFWSLPALADDIKGQISRIIDGDTFDLAGKTIRLCGIDAPEHGDHGFAEAIVALSEITAGRTVRCVQVGQGTVCDGRSRPTNNGRVVAQCFVSDQDIADELVRRGVACDWGRFSGGHYSRDGSGRPCE